MSSAPAPMITPDNCPRDAEGLRVLSRVVRYRLALNLGIFANETPHEAAFASADDQTQIQTLLTALQARDAQMSNGHQYAPPPGQQMAPAPLTPQPLAVAPAPAPGGYPMPPQGMPQQQQPQQPQQQQPQQQYAPPPGPMPPAYAPPPPMAPPSMPPQHQAAPPPPAYAPPPAPQVYAPPPPMGPPGAPPPPAPQAYAPPPMQPQQQYAPPPPAAQQYAPPPAPQQQQQPPAPPAPMVRQPSTYGDPSNQGAQQATGNKLAELENTVLGMARTQNMLFNLVLDLSQHLLGLDKQTIAIRLIQHAQAGEPMKFFEAGVQQGKVG